MKIVEALLISTFVLVTGTLLLRLPASAQSTAFAQGDDGQPCHLLTSSSPIPPNWGAPFNTLSSSRELILSASCSSEGATISAGTGAPTQYIYENAYEYRDGTWHTFKYTGSQKTGPWIVGKGSATLSRTQAQLSQNSFFTAYVCIWSGSQWKCGCRDAACVTNYWMLQAINKSTSDGTTPANANECLSRSGTKLHLTGAQTSAPNVSRELTVDAWDAIWKVPIKFPIRVVGESADDVCFSGGSYINTEPLDATERERKFGGTNIAYSDSGTIINYDGSERTIIEGIFSYNAHNAYQYIGALPKGHNPWVVKHSWFEYCRGSCIENDSTEDGVLFDNLIDGAYMFLSMHFAVRGAEADKAALERETAKNVVRIEKNLVRLEPQPGPYGPGNSITIGGKTYGHGWIFKTMGRLERRNPWVILKDNVFLLEIEPEENGWDCTGASGVDEAAKCGDWFGKLEECSNNVFVWLPRSGEEPPKFHPDIVPGGASCMRIVTGEEGRRTWREAVRDWHARHPNVGKQFKPKIPGTWQYPRTCASEGSRYVNSFTVPSHCR